MSRSLRLVALGAVAGLIAAWAMEESQKALSQAAQAAGAEPPSGDPTTVKAADRLSLSVTGYPIAQDKRSDAGRLVHYATGAGLGVIYTLLADRLRFITAGFGGLYGMLTAAILDEWIVPEAGLSAPAQEVPLERHAEGLAAHLVYGAALEASRRTLVLVA